MYIGKEANKIENNFSGLDTGRVNVYNRESLLKDKITSMTLKDALKLSIPRRTFYRLKNQIKKEEKLQPKKKTKNKLI